MQREKGFLLRWFVLETVLIWCPLVGRRGVIQLLLSGRSVILPIVRRVHVFWLLNSWMNLLVRGRKSERRVWGRKKCTNGGRSPGDTFQSVVVG